MGIIIFKALSNYQSVFFILSYQYTIGGVIMFKEPTHMIINKMIYEVQGFYRASGEKITDKLFKLMEKELENYCDICHNESITQKINTVGTKGE